jgi:hypothetical protein
VATVAQQLDPGAAQFLATAFPQGLKNGTNFPVYGLFFDAATTESAYWMLRAVNYGTGNLTVDLDWYADTATSGVVRWGVQITAITPDTDTTDVETDTLATAQTADDTHLGTTAQRVQRCPVTVTNLDSLAAGDDVWIRVYREGGNAADTLVGDAVLVGIAVSYSDT